jgi:PIF1-like helicase
LLVDPDSPQAELLREMALIIWDEATMAHQSTFECVDNLLRQVMKKDLPFGGKVMILLRDFCQTCLVIPQGSHAQVINASIQASPLWSHFSILHLI